MRKTAALIFALGTIGVISVCVETLSISTNATYMFQTIIVCMGMECCSLLPIIIEKDF